MGGRKRGKGREAKCTNRNVGKQEGKAGVLDSY